MNQPLESTIEALLFLSPDPVDADALADATGAELHEVVSALERLREYYEFERRGLVLRELAGGWVLSTHPDAEAAARRLLARPRTPTLTPAQAETLAIVAYLQPVSRPEIARIRESTPSRPRPRCSSVAWSRRPVAPSSGRSYTGPPSCSCGCSV